MKFLREFQNDDEWDYYGDLKATTIYLQRYKLYLLSQFMHGWENYETYI